eukprot:scaffold552553_cov39-Prasinocladus_malaysianus.AAC.1
MGDQLSCDLVRSSHTRTSTGTAGSLYYEYCLGFRAYLCGYSYSTRTVCVLMYGTILRTVFFPYEHHHGFLENIKEMKC